VDDVSAGGHHSRARSDAPVVLVPVKAFHDAKHRLAGVLGPDERSALARRLAHGVVRSARGLRVAVVCDDADVAAWARSVGAEVLWHPGPGLNAAVTAAVDTLAGCGVGEVVVAHADLPLAEDLSVVAGFAGVTLVPDRHDDGTNVIALPTRSGFCFSYGAGSFDRHRAEAERLGLPLRILRDPALGWDVDVPDDLGPCDVDGHLSQGRP
jgi:2-phospho-L-lactate/phosphoenolpyruvate guanylyltransferase